MNLTKRQINNKLKGKLLTPITTRENKDYIQYCEIKVIRARNVKYGYWKGRKKRESEKTLVTVEISGAVLSSKGEYLPLHYYGPRHIRNYLRKKHNGIVGAVSSWVKLWGFDNNIELERIKLIKTNKHINKINA
jgi:hypothetical protein